MACNMTENALSVLIVIFSVQLQQTEISERKLFIFQHGTAITRNSALISPETLYERWYRFGKSTHIAMISNSVTHLRSYTNFTIAGNSTPISLETPRECRYCHTKRRCRRIEWRVFRDVSQHFKSVS